MAYAFNKLRKPQTTPENAIPLRDLRTVCVAGALAIGLAGCAGGPPYGNIPGGSLGCNIAESNVPTVYTYIHNNTNLSSVAISGIIGNMQYESGSACINPYAIGDKGTSYGIVMLHNSRWSDLENATGQREPDLVPQLEYVVHTLKIDYSSVYAQLENDTSPRQATDDFASGFEECGPCDLSDRERFADNDADYASAHGWPGAAPMPTVTKNN